MAPTRRQLLTVVTGAMSLPLAGCVEGGPGGQDGDGGAGGYGMDTATDDTTTDAEAESDSQSAEAAPTLAVEPSDQFGDIVVGPDGSTVYMFEQDPADASESACSGGCADAWPPLTVEDAESVSIGDAVTATVDTFQRDDGSNQVALGGWPLYYFQGDAEPGDVSGQGVNKAWWVLAPDGRPREPTVQIREHVDHGSILTDPDGMTLYMFDQDSQDSGESACTGGCADAWPPLIVDEERTVLAGGDIAADVSTITRPDGSTQVSVDGWPVYRYQNDDAVGDASGQGVSDAWWVLAPDGSVIRPDATGETTTTTTTTEGPDYGDGY